jgi:PAS domain S-box-containing protein
MPKHNVQPSIPAQLRTRAEEHIRSGTAPATHGWPVGAQALALLHDLASTPSSASDSLKLLHELQVHQIELDLQHEQADQDRLQLAQAQAGYVALFDLAPFAYLTLNPDGQVMDANRMACAWSGVEHDTRIVRQVEDFFALDCRQTVQNALLRLRKGSTSEVFSVQSRADGSRLQVRATATPGGQLVLMAFMPAATAGH